MALVKHSFTFVSFSPSSDALIQSNLQNMHAAEGAVTKSKILREHVRPEPISFAQVLEKKILAVRKKKEFYHKNPSSYVGAHDSPMSTALTINSTFYLELFTKQRPWPRPLSFCWFSKWEFCEFTSSP